VASPHPIDVMVGKRIRLRRLQLSMSQGVLADRLGISFQQVQKYEKGTNRVSSSRLYDIAEILDVPIPFFFSGPSDSRPEVKLIEQLRPGDLKDGLRLFAAFRSIKGKRARRSVIALVESMSEPKKKKPGRTARS
jgi:transcriptional regulator with XRE-family HTH domain